MSFTTAGKGNLGLARVGTGVGVGTVVGTIVGAGVGTGVGTGVGSGVGTGVGTMVAIGVGTIVGTIMGATEAVGTGVGPNVGTGVGSWICAVVELPTAGAFDSSELRMKNQYTRIKSTTITIAMTAINNIGPLWLLRRSGTLLSLITPS